MVKISLNKNIESIKISSWVQENKIMIIIKEQKDVKWKILMNALSLRGPK
jgi:hypothetical protein